MKAPWLKFYPTDWRADPALRMCSIAARGLWMETLCIMHEAEPYGMLKVKGKSVSDKQLAGLVGVSIEETATLLAELEQAGVFSRAEDGTILSRRMMRDRHKAEADQANGKRGGNPKLKRGVNPPVKAQKPEARIEREGADAPSSSELVKPAPSAVIALPTVTEGEVPFFETDVAEWSASFPAVNVRQQLAAMRSWLIANPTKRKTRRGMRKFVVGWLDRKQNAGGVGGGTGPPAPSTRRQNFVDVEMAVRNGTQDISGDRDDAELFSPGKPASRSAAGDLQAGVLELFAASRH